jgi:hypothetical protein
MLPEAGFFAAFLVPSRMRPSVLPILILRWMLFRVEMGAGLIKLRRFYGRITGAGNRNPASQGGQAAWPEDWQLAVGLHHVQAMDWRRTR